MGASTDTCTTSSHVTPKLPALFKGSYGTMYYVRNMKNSLDFYKNVIGLTATCEDEGWAQLNLGTHALCLHPAGDKAITPGGGTLIIEVSDIRKVVSSLKEKRVEFLGDVNDMGECGLCADFKDLDGNIVGLYQAPARLPHAEPKL